MIGKMQGTIKDLEVGESSSDEEYEEEQYEEENKKSANHSSKPSKKGGMFSLFRGLVGSKNLSQSDMQPVLDKLKDHLIGKNVASDIALKLCDSVAAKLEGRVLGTFDTVAATVKATLTESLVQILSPRRRVDILRDCIETQKKKRAYVMTFCGVRYCGLICVANLIVFLANCR